MPKVLIIPVIIICSLLISSCRRENSDVDVSNIAVDAEFKRFDVELFSQFYDNPLDRYLTLKSRYGQFFDLYVHQVLQIPEGSDNEVATGLESFVNDAEIKGVFKDVDSAYKSTTAIEAQMKEFLQHFKYYFPDRPVPRVITAVMAFNYAVIATDSAIGIGLDMFLGKDAIYYPRLGIPKYMSDKFSSAYIVPAAVKGWFQSDYDQEQAGKDLLSQMVYQGKMLYYVKSMISSVHDTLITGYSEKQLQWCIANEANTWSYFIENKLLFSTDPSEYAKYVNEGPSTTGFPPGAPGKVGAFTGWQIVKAYVEKNNNISLQQLLEEKNSQKILEESGYKPKK